NSFEGRWQLSRCIEQEGATMLGAATFARTADGGLLYEEAGLLTLRDGQTLRCTRRYRFVARGESLVILFNDGPDAGKPFVELVFADTTPGVLIAADKHFCGRDIYAVEYRLQLPASYETDVLVAGPNKRYRAVTQYAKAL